VSALAAHSAVHAEPHFRFLCDYGQHGFATTILLPAGTVNIKFDTIVEIIYDTAPFLNHMMKPLVEILAVMPVLALEADGGLYGRNVHPIILPSLCG
jgi:hypothetical protein